LLSGEQDDIVNNDQSADSRRAARIKTKFENSQYYIAPLTTDENGVDVNNHNLFGDSDSMSIAPKNHQTLPCESTNNNSADENGSSTTKVLKTSLTLEITGISKEIDDNKKNSLLKTVNNTCKINDKNEETDHEDCTSSNNNNNEINNLPCLFTEKTIEIVRPINYSQRGFGFLLNTGVLSNSTKSTNDRIIILKNGDEETKVPNENYAQVVVVEHGKLMNLKCF
jgi:hypothetical protein